LSWRIEQADEFREEVEHYTDAERVILADAYLARRIKQGKSKREVIRCLKRYVAREVFAALKQMDPNETTIAT
jgi:hypothetical protein